MGAILRFRHNVLRSRPVFVIAACLYSAASSKFSTLPGMITIYHNPRCSKSRETLALVQAAAERLGETVEVVEYLKTPPALATLQALHAGLAVPVRQMIRDNEAIYQELGLGDASLSDAELLAAVADHPLLLQRPIVVRGKRAVIGRPPQTVQDLLA